MTEQLQLRRGTATQIAAFTGAQGEIVVDTTNNRAVVNDGSTAGGWPAAKLSEVVTNARTSVSDAAYTALASDRSIAFTALTAARVVTLPASSAYPTGTPLTVFDESGNCSAALTITLNAAGSDKIDGASSAVISNAYGFLALQSNGAGKWTIVDQATSNLGPVGIGTPADPDNPLSVYGSSALFNGNNFNVTVNKAAGADTASFIFDDGFSGRAQIGLCGDDNLHFKVSPNGSSWFEGVNINSGTGQPSFPLGIASGEAIGFRNRLRNAAFAVNQRAVSGTVTLAAGAYGHDGVKAGASGATYTFAQSGIDTTLTVAAGSLILPIESVLIEGGSYTVSQAGGAQARIWQGTGYTGSGSYATAPFTVTGLTAATQTNLEFSTGTVLRPQFEPGVVATAFERRPLGVELAICQRYFQATLPANGAGNTFFNGDITTGSTYFAQVTFPVEMRATPTIVFTNQNASNFPTTPGTAYANVFGVFEGRSASATGYGSFGSSLTASAEI